MASAVISQSNGSKGIMTFYPTPEEFKNFSRYIAYVESQGAHKAGLAKIVPPKDWKPRKSYDDIDDLVIPAPIQQVVTGQSGLFTQYNIQKKSMTVREFRKMANSDKFCSPHYDDFEELERKYWKNVTFNPPIYGADVNGSLYGPDVKEWNICHLNTILDTVECESGITIEGVNTPYLYFGMWKTTFAWHTEDMDLYSINYLHYGKPKSWYCVPPEHGKRLERLAQGFFPGSSQNCEAFLRHKMTLISPSILKKYGIPFEKITQEAGEFMVTFPYAYHAGFNHGFNCAESTNFATERWIEYGKQAVLCSCRRDMVKISMDVFVKKFQPDRYEQWLAGRDVLPIDHTRPTPEAKEFLGESFNDLSTSNSTESCGDDGERKSTTQRIETKRHRVCLEVPEEVVPKDEDEEDVEQYGKRPRLSLIPPRTMSQDGKRNKGRKPEVRKSEVRKPEVRRSEVRKPEVRRSEVRKPEVKREVKREVELTCNSTRKTHPQIHLPEMSRPVIYAPKNNKRKSNQSPLVDSSMISPNHTGPVQKPICDKVKVKQHVSVEQSYCKSVVKKQQLQARLCKLPRHHPLIREVHSGDEEHIEEEFEQEEKEEWAKPLTQLWQCRPYNPRAEREYNKSMGQQAPYCSICLVFYTYHESDSDSGSSSVTLVNRPGGHQWSKPLIPEMCFNTQSSKTNENGEGQLSNPHVAEDGTSRLVSCAQCCVRVHTSCYGVNGDEAELDGWLCARCEANATTEDCCLCSLRGGALQRANDDKWVHVLCAITVLEARFVNITERGPIDLSTIPLPRFKLKCAYCRKRMKREVNGCCVQCSHGRCSTAFHPTCAQAAGMIMHPDDWPFTVFITCNRHKTPSIPERNKTSMRELSVKQRVICKYRNTRYYHSEVVELTAATFYEVVFDDGSYSNNLFPEDIENRDCGRLGPPAEGDPVQVRWTDGLIYGAKFMAAHSIPMYLSVASDMRFELFSQSDVKKNSKRQRVINSRYREDFVEPVIYRAIME
ncbi:Lysine-specific demethylase 4A [Liparis tanakae]|uniref:[histone H3]-trimethyl-L-lysine(9) demethylase n=1 Tax=Liparis tanakae TaxID=230148 RepID=A0A4Z2IGH2_9TELE|nr:Lysine-specific demethylase 4A [Liparis tanakae]